MLAKTSTLYISNFTNQNIENYKEINGNNIKLTGYCHNIRITKKLVFVVLRREDTTIQLIIFKEDHSDIYDKIIDISNESTIDIEGEIVNANIQSCSVTNFEIKVHKLNIISISNIIPFTLDDANETFNNQDNDENDRSKVGREIRLDNRWLDLRTTINHKLMKIRSLIEFNLRKFSMKQGFIEIHTPKLISAVSEGGSNVFDVNYFNKKVFLAQSPQLYKQIMINSGFNGVFEIGSIFRAENSNTYRHLCEFTGFDLEFIINPDQNHHDIINIIWKILYKTFMNLNSLEDVNYILGKIKVEPLVFPENPVIIDFLDGVNLLGQIGVYQDPLDDINSSNEKKLGEIIKEKYNTDMYVLINYPYKCRPFYTMKEGENYSRSFDIMMRGNEIASGAQRNHDPEILKNAIIEKGIILDDNSGLLDYIKSFEYGAIPHGGCGIGIERLIMLYFGLNNIRITSLFPRDPKRIIP